VKEYEIFVPLSYNDGRQVEPEQFRDLQKQLPDHFGGLTFFPQPNEGYWTMAGVTYRDEIIIYRVISSNSRAALRFLSRLKEQLKVRLDQEEILIIEREVEAL
jgi:hypothetical protein